MKAILKKTVMMLTIAAVLACSVLAGTTEVQAANNNKAQVKQIKATIKKVMNNAKNSKDKAVYQYLKSSDPQQMDSIKKLRKQSAVLEMKKTNPAYYNYITKYNKKLSYKVQKVKVKGKTAQVKLKIRTIDSKSVADQCNAILTRDFANDEIAAQINALDTMEAITAYASSYAEKMFQEAVATANPTGTKAKVVTVYMKKVGKKWMITDEGGPEAKNGFNEIMNLMYADLVDAMSGVDYSKIDYSKIDVEKLMMIVMGGAGLSPDDLSKVNMP